MSTSEYVMATMTSTLWVKTTGSRHTWVWPEPRNAPLCSIAAAATWTNFNVKETWSGLFLQASTYFPWYVHPNVKSTKIYATVAASPIFPITIRARTKTLVDAVATVTGAASKSILEVFASPPLEGQWSVNAKFDGYTSYYALQCSIENIDVPASRHVLIGVQAQYASGTYASINPGQTYPVRLVNLMIAEEIEVPNGSP